MSDGLFFALLGLGGAIVSALLTAFIQPILAQKIGPKSKLAVTVEFFEFRLPEYMRKSIDSYNSLRWEAKSNVKPTKDTFEKLNFIQSCKGYIKITIRNNSNKSINRIRINLNNNGDIIADAYHDGTKVPSKFGKFYEIESILARSQHQVELWTFSSINSSYFTNISEVVFVSADEIDHISIITPTPNFVQRKYLLLSRKLIWKAYWVAVFFIFVFSIYITAIKIPPN